MKCEHPFATVSARLSSLRDAGCACSGTGPGVRAGQGATARTLQGATMFPPWQHGANNDAAQRVAWSSRCRRWTCWPTSTATLDRSQAGAVMWAATTFSPWRRWCKAFEEDAPGVQGPPVFWETIPPGLLVKQMEAGGTVTVGNMTWTVPSRTRISQWSGERSASLIQEGLLDRSEAVPYVTNTLDHHGAERQPGSASKGWPTSAGPGRQAGDAESRVRGHRAADQDGAHQGGRRRIWRTRSMTRRSRTARPC